MIKSVDLTGLTMGQSEAYFLRRTVDLGLLRENQYLGIVTLDALRGICDTYCRWWFYRYEGD